MELIIVGVVVLFVVMGAGQAVVNAERAKRKGEVQPAPQVQEDNKTALLVGGVILAAIVGGAMMAAM